MINAVHKRELGCAIAIHSFRNGLLIRVRWIQLRHARYDVHVIWIEEGNQSRIFTL